MKWVGNQPADLMIFARDASHKREPESFRSWVIRLPGSAGKLEYVHGKSHEWRYEYRHVRLAGSCSDMTKSTPVVFLPWPSPSRDDGWFAAAQQTFVDISDSKMPWFLLAHYSSKEAEWAGSAEVSTLNLSDVARATIAIFGVTRAPKSESRRLWLDVEACNDPVSQHAWIG